MTLLFIVISILYIYGLYHFWNIGIMIAGLILIFTRLPDLIFEMKTGDKLNSKNMPKRHIDKICTILSLLTLPLIVYSLYYLK